MVYVPRARLGLAVDEPSAFLRAKIRKVVDRSIVVDLPGGTESKPIASSAAHANVGVTIVRVGDFDTEGTLLDPLAKSLLQFCRLLLPDDMVVLREVRARRRSGPLTPCTGPWRPSSVRPSSRTTYCGARL